MWPIARERWSSLVVNAVLKVKFQRQLDLPRRPLQRGLGACRGDGSRSRVADCRRRVVELRRIGDVEDFAPELRVGAVAFGVVEILEQRSVDLQRTGTLKNIAPAVPELVQGRRDEAGDIEVFLQGALG